MVPRLHSTGFNDEHIVFKQTSADLLLQAPSPRILVSPPTSAQFPHHAKQPFLLQRCFPSHRNFQDQENIMFSLVFLLTGSGKGWQKTVVNPVQLEMFKCDLGREMDGLQVMEDDSGLMLNFSLTLLVFPFRSVAAESNCRFFGTVHCSFLTSLMTMYAQDSCKTWSLALQPSSPTHKQHTRTAALHPCPSRGPGLLFCSDNPRCLLQLYT